MIEKIITAKIRPDGSELPFPDAAIREMIEAEIVAAAEADPDRSNAAPASAFLGFDRSRRVAAPKNN